MKYWYLEHLAELGATNIHPSGQTATLHLIKILSLSPDQRVLEIGCGTGGTLAPLLCTFPISIAGVDLLPRMLSVAKRRLHILGVAGRGILVNARAGNLPFAEEQYDRVYTESVLGIQNEKDARDFLTEIKRVLKPRGIYVANEAIWKTTASEHIIETIAKQSLADFGLIQASRQAWYLDDWLALMNDVGFKVAVLPLEDFVIDRSIKRTFQKGMFLSKLVTLFFQSKRYLIPRLIQTEQAFNQKLKKYRHAGQYIEAKLFILEKI